MFPRPSAREALFDKVIERAAFVGGPNEKYCRAPRMGAPLRK
jgi:hypothetical protein